MLTVADDSVLEDVERAMSENPLPKKVIDDVRTIYSSHKLGLPKDSLWGEPVLCDFGEARIGEFHQGLVQPELYRAPEVLFQMEWTSSINIWSVAALVSVPASTNPYFLTEFKQACDLFENEHLFNAVDEDGQPSATHHIAEMVAYLGLPPVEYIQRSEITKKVFDEQG
jgi:serine/threonine protein kinase